MIRTKTNGKVYCQKLEKTLKIGELAQQVPLGIKIKSIKYTKKMVDVYANEVDVIIEQDGIKTIKQKDGTAQQIKIPGDLVNISGRLVEKKKLFTAPALLAGLWTFLTIIETISVHSYEDLLRMKEELQDILGLCRKVWFSIDI